MVSNSSRTMSARLGTDYGSTSSLVVLNYSIQALFTISAVTIYLFHAGSLKYKEQLGLLQNNNLGVFK